MEIKTCEEYVLNELNNCQREIELLKKILEENKKSKKSFLDINVFSKYDLTISSNYSHIDPECSAPDDISFTDTESTDVVNSVDGGKLIELIREEMEDDDFIGIEVLDGEIRFESFRGTTGEGGTTTYKIKRSEVQ